VPGAKLKSAQVYQYALPVFRRLDRPNAPEKAADRSGGTDVTTAAATMKALPKAPRDVYLTAKQVRQSSRTAGRDRRIKPITAGLLTPIGQGINDRMAEAAQPTRPEMHGGRRFHAGGA